MKISQISLFLIFEILFCVRPKKRRGHKKVIIAIYRMILTASYHMFSTGELYDTQHYRKVEVLPVKRNITIEQAILIARSQGYRIREQVVS